MSAERQLGPVTNGPPAKPPRPHVTASFRARLGLQGGWRGLLLPFGRKLDRARQRRALPVGAAGGEARCRSQPKEHCLEREPLRIEADVRRLPDRKPDAYSFIPVEPEGEPVEMTGVRPRVPREDGAITIHPATCRLVHDRDQ